jgi:hypothetical protein
VEAKQVMIISLCRIFYPITGSAGNSNIFLTFVSENYSMKKLILLLFAFTGACSLSAQHYALPSKELNGEFVEIYSHTDKKQNIIQRLSETNNVFFSIYNESVKNAVSGLQKKYKLAADSAVYIIFDSVMYSFARDHIWDEYTGPKEKYIPFLELYNKTLCPCLGEKIRSSRFHRLEAKDMSNCVQKLLTDTSYINGVKRTMGASTMNEVYDAAQMGLPYVYQQCKVFYDYYAIVIGSFNYNFVRDLNNSLNEIDKTLAELYKNKPAELEKVFPGYKKYETDIKLAANMFDNNEVYDMTDRTKKASEQVMIVKTYYRDKNMKTVLFGQVVFVLKDEITGSPVLSFKFTPAAKIKDPEKYLSRIHDEGIVEPPPMEEKRIDIIIDTTQKKNR